jgi:hypothetical protein
VVVVDGVIIVVRVVVAVRMVVAVCVIVGRLRCGVARGNEQSGGEA